MAPKRGGGSYPERRPAARLSDCARYRSAGSVQMPRHETAQRAAVARKGQTKTCPPGTHASQAALSTDVRGRKQWGAVCSSSRCRRAAKPVRALSGAHQVVTWCELRTTLRESCAGFRDSTFTGRRHEHAGKLYCIGRERKPAKLLRGFCGPLAFTTRPCRPQDKISGSGEASANATLRIYCRAPRIYANSCFNLPEPPGISLQS